MKYLSLALSLFIISGCNSFQTDLGQQTASHIARPAFMVERDIDAGDFAISAWERMHARHQVATIYIEGDGVHQRLHQTSGTTPTPKNPVALHLASRDLSKNLAYLARPCQYLKNPQSKGCDEAYWREKRYTPEVFTAYQNALDDIATRYDITGFHLVGYDGGANIAAILAAKRKDVLSLRTVAGDLNPDLESDLDKHKPLVSNSLLAVDHGLALSAVPQHHYIGAADEIVTPASYHSYRQAVGLSDCVHYSLIQDADHTRGWVEKWPELLQVQPQCAVIHTDLPELPPAGDFPGDFYKGPKLKK